VKQWPPVHRYALAVLQVAAVLFPSAAWAQSGGNPNRFVVRPNTPAFLTQGPFSFLLALQQQHHFPNTAYGASYAEWLARRAQWLYAIPTAENPLLDPTGDKAHAGQPGPVLFLVEGTKWLPQCTRRCTVPAGTPIFLSVAGRICIGDTAPAALACAAVRPVAGSVRDLAVDLDGVAIRDLQDFYTRTALFPVTLPADNLFGAPAGLYPATAEGYVLMLSPLPVGQHVLRARATYLNPDGSVEFEQDVTYHLTVARR
jgi:hypothetical protein